MSIGFVSPDPLNNLTNLYQRPIFIVADRLPTSNDLQPPGTEWSFGGTIYQSNGAGVWDATSGGGSVSKLTAGSGGALSPSLGNFNLIGTNNQVLTVGSGSTITWSLATTLIAPGSIAATLGNVTATNGNFVKGTAGNKDVYTSVATNGTAGANSAGSVTLVGGTATIATTSVTASSLIRLYRQSVGATGAAALGILSRGTITASTSFVINSVQIADATALQTTDVSVVFWEIVN